MGNARAEWIEIMRGQAMKHVLDRGATGYPTVIDLQLNRGMIARKAANAQQEPSSPSASADELAILKYTWYHSPKENSNL